MEIIYFAKTLDKSLPPSFKYTKLNCVCVT